MPLPVFLTTLALASHAGAETVTRSPRCAAILAEARSTASVLAFPHVELRALHAPPIGDGSGVGVSPTQPNQLRGGLAYQPLDTVKARSVLALAEAECRRQETREALERLLQQGAQFGRREAIQAELDVLDGGRPSIDALVAEAEERLARGLTTVVEVDALRLRRFDLDARVGDLRVELAALGAAPVLDARPPADLLARYEAAALDVVKEESFVRQLAAFRVDLQAGAIPWPQPDWFGMVTLSYALGQAGQPAAEAEVLASRGEDLRQSAGELRARVERFLDAMQATVVALRNERVVIDRQLVLLDNRLAASPEESDRVRQARAGWVLERLHLQGRRASVSQLLATRAALGSTAS